MDSSWRSRRLRRKEWACCGSGKTERRMKLTHVGVVGAGNIGAGVVTDLVLHGINAVVVDLSEEILKEAEAQVLKNIRFASLFSKSLPRLTREDTSRRLV